MPVCFDAFVQPHLPVNVVNLLACVVQPHLPVRWGGLNNWTLL